MVITVTFENNKTKTFETFQDLFLIPKEKLCKIKVLVCCDFRITVVPPEIGVLKSLREFYCNNTRITVIPPEIGELKSLQKFYCSGSQITVIPPEISALKSLREFDCSRNEIRIIPPEIGELKNLQTFICSGKITVIPPEIGELKSLRVFVCIYCNITLIPSEIGELKRLQEFYCNGNQITVIPPEIGELKSLQVFDCSYNQIRTVPPEIGELKSLREFNCRYNQITVIPPEIGELESLRKFVCSGNQIRIVPFEMTLCREIQDFNYTENEIDVLNPAVQRFVDNLKNYEEDGGIYTDSQNVHNSAIQSSIKESIITILNEWTEKVCEERILDHLLKNELITTQPQILEYFLDNTVHSVVNVTFKELFLIIYQRLIKDNQTEVFKILNQEMKDSECKCFTGRLNRLVSSLSGFYSEVKVSISKSDEIGNVISVMKKKFRDTLTLKQKVSEELLSRGYLETDFKEWLEYIE